VSGAFDGDVRGGAFDWAFHPPASPAIGDHDVPLLSRHLEGRLIALLVGGGIAAMKAPLLARALRRRGAEVTAFCTAEALRYVGAEALEWSTCRPLVRELSWRAEHLSDGEGFAAYLVAPATYNTIGKAAGGIARRSAALQLGARCGVVHAEGLLRLFLLLHGEGLRAALSV
jgi:phosphopantothenoylcysteine decarboxylase/phosphopantothenate--cysteine ligase